MSAMEEKSYRFKPARETLPKDVPSWFTALLSRDANRDGQIDMSEYASGTWTESKLREFTQRDKDGDGIISIEDTVTSR